MTQSKDPSARIASLRSALRLGMTSVAWMLPASPHAAGTGAARSIDDRLDAIIALLTEIRDALKAQR